MMIFFNSALRFQLHRERGKMNKEEILKKAVEKAQANSGEIFCQRDDKTGAMGDLDFKDWIVNNNEAKILFNHSFAKAFWGEEKICNRCKTKHDSGNSCTCCKEYPECMVCGKGKFFPEWQIHLQQMVICEEPLEYIAKFL